MPDRITFGDVYAICDVANQLANEADDLTADDAVRFLDAVAAAKKALGDAEAFLRARALTQIEQPIIVDGSAYSKVAAVKKRPDQALVQRKVVAIAAAPDENGELPPVVEAVERAVELMAGLYVSPSTVPKVGGVNALGLAIWDVVREEHTGWELKETKLP